MKEPTSRRRQSSRRWYLIYATCCCAALVACRINNTGPDPEGHTFFDPLEVSGLYDLHEVDGHAIGWYHTLAAVDCQVAFMSGNLELADNADFILRLDFNYRCVDNTEAPDGSDRLFVQGKIRSREGNMYVLRGRGTNYIQPDVDDWLLEVTPNGDFITLRFGGQHRAWFADPVLTMGPRVDWVADSSQSR